MNRKGKGKKKADKQIGNGIHINKTGKWIKAKCSKQTMHKNNTQRQQTNTALPYK